MPIECAILKERPEPFRRCPACGARPFRSYLRGVFRRGRRRFLILGRRPYCCIVCDACKRVVGYEWPETLEVVLAAQAWPPWAYRGPRPRGGGSANR